nr:MAG TPA: hypothetical protein [Caudoviricetes sp.]
MLLSTPMVLSVIVIQSALINLSSTLLLSTYMDLKVMIFMHCNA